MLKKIFNFFGYSFYKIHKTNDEKEIIDLQIKKTNPDLIIDCGANHGDFYKSIKKHNKKVIAFEPNPKLYNKLSNFSQNDKNLTFFPKGTDSKNCKKKIYITDDTGQTLSSTKKQTDFLKKRFKKSKIVNEKIIEMVSLNYILSKMKISKQDRIFLKLDTQGNDYETLIGLKKRINQVKIIKIEIPVINLYYKVKSQWEILNFFKKNKFVPINFLNGQRDKDGKIIEYDAIFMKK